MHLRQRQPQAPSKKAEGPPRRRVACVPARCIRRVANSRNAAPPPFPTYKWRFRLFFSHHSCRKSLGCLPSHLDGLGLGTARALPPVAAAASASASSSGSPAAAAAVAAAFLAARELEPKPNAISTSSPAAAAALPPPPPPRDDEALPPPPVLPPPALFFFAPTVPPALVEREETTAPPGPVRPRRPMAGRGVDERVHGVANDPTGRRLGTEPDQQRLFSRTRIRDAVLMQVNKDDSIVELVM